MANDFVPIFVLIIKFALVKFGRSQSGTKFVPLLTSV